MLGIDAGKTTILFPFTLPVSQVLPLLTRNRTPPCLVFALLLVLATAANACAQESGIVVGDEPARRFIQPAWDQNLPMLGMQFVIATWIFVLGACFGSFLNVVIYRLPAGMSLGKPKSRCPRCETPLAVRDNIPVVGWLLLRGKCRYCHLPIAARYPIIEGICGAIFLTLLFGELLTGAANLPLRHPDHFHINPGFWLIWFTKWDLSGIYLYHCCLLIVVLGTVMIGYDGHQPQTRLTAFGIIVGVIAGMLWSELRPVPAAPYSEFVQSLQWGFSWNDPLINPDSRYWTGISLTGLCDGLAGIVGGLLAGWLLRWQINSQAEDSAGVTTVAAVSTALLITGAFLGWQACGMLSLTLMPVLALFKAWNRSVADSRRLLLAGPAFPVALLVFILFWQELNDAAWMIGYRGWDFTSLSWWQDWLATFMLMIVFATVIRFCARKRDIDSTADDTPGIP